MPNFFIGHLSILVRCKPKAQSEPGARLTAHLAIRCLIANYCMRWHEIFKGLSRDEGLADLKKNYQASLFEPNFGRIHLAEQYLEDLPLPWSSSAQFSIDTRLNRSTETLEYESTST
jgi:hypothetical protein